MIQWYTHRLVQSSSLSAEHYIALKKTPVLSTPYSLLPGATATINLLSASLAHLFWMFHAKWKTYVWLHSLSNRFSRFIHAIVFIRTSFLTPPSIDVWVCFWNLSSVLLISLYIPIRAFYSILKWGSVSHPDLSPFETVLAILSLLLAYLFIFLKDLFIYMGGRARWRRENPSRICAEHGAWCGV